MKPKVKIKPQSLLRKARGAAGITQVALARIVDITPQYLQRIEYGQQTPTVSVALRIAQALGTTVEDLFGR